MARQSMREEIVEAAAERFHTHGYNAAGVKDITADAGVPKGSFYNHFASKEALALTILERYGTTRRLAELADPAVPPVERLRRHFTFLRDEQQEYGYSRGCLLGNFGAEIADHSGALRDGVEHGFDAWSQALSRAVADAVRDGSADPGLDPDDTALFLLCAWEGAILTARAARSDRPFAVFFAQTFDHLLAAPQH